MNGYDLTAWWFSYADENPDWVDTNTTALFFAIVQRSNELRWKTKFQLPALNTMQRIGIRSPKTYYPALKKLVEAGFISIVEEAKNQFTACIIEINAPVVAEVKITEAQVIAQVVAPTSAQVTAQVVARETNTNNKTTKQLNKQTKEDGKNAVTLPVEFSENFSAVWGQLLTQPNWKNKPSTALQLSLKKLSKFEEGFAIDLIEKAIIGQWKGLFFPETENDYQKWKNSNQQPQRNALNEPTYQDLLKPEFKAKTEAPTFRFNPTCQ